MSIKIRKLTVSNSKEFPGNGTKECALIELHPHRKSEHLQLVYSRRERTLYSSVLLRVRD